MAAMERIHHNIMFVAILVCAMVAGSQGAVMSIDLGNEWIKVAIVSPGKPMEVALNTDSSRKTPMIVAFRNGERHFGEAALTTATRFPEKSYTYLLDVIGKKMDNPLVQTYIKRFPYLNITSDPVKSTVIFNHPEGMSFTPEELLGMILEKCRTFAEIAAGDGAKISEVVITIPPYFSQSERRGILSAASLAGLKVLQLMNSNTGVALNYGVFRIKDFNESTPNHILFYDMGSTATIATIASYQVVKTKEKGFVEKVPTLTIAGVGYDRTLGGLEMQLILRDHLAKKFSEQHKIPLEKVTGNYRAMSKLLKESARVKKILSANTETNARVENVMDDLDLKVEVTRSDFEALCGNILSDRLMKPVRDALSMSGLSLSSIDQVILFGGNTRVPKVQEALSQVVGGKELGKSINADEASALGSVYQAAYLSKGFKVKQFTVKDINLFPIQVEFNRNLELEEGQEGQKVKSMTRVIFGRGNVFPQKKVLTFSKHNEDFDFFVNYGDLNKILTKEEVSQIGSFNISRSSVKGVKAAFDKQLQGSDAAKKEAKGIKAHFKLDESGIIVLDSIEATFESKVEEDSSSNPDSNVVSDTIANLGKTFSQFFSSQKIDPEGNVEINPEINQTNDTESNQTSSENSTKEESSSGNKTDNKNGTESGNQTQSVPKKEIKIKTIKEPLEFTMETIDVVASDSDAVKESVKKLKELRKKDEDKLKHDSIRNNLESFIAETKMKLHENEYEVATTDQEREAMISQLNQASEWLEYESDGAKTEDLQSKLSALKTATSGMFDRVREHRERPEAVKALQDMLNISSLFLENAKNLTEDQQIFTDVEINSLDLLVTETTEWIHVSTVEQGKLPLSSSPAVTIKQIAEKISSLDREVKYLVNKLKITPPKKKPEPAKETEKDEEEEQVTDDEKEEERTSSEEENANESAKVNESMEMNGTNVNEGTEQTDQGINSASSAPEQSSEAGTGDKEHSKRKEKRKRRRKGTSLNEEEAHSEL